MISRFLTFCAAAGALSFSGAAPAHEGVLDSYGCHYNEIMRTYHCHRGPLAGHRFESKSEMREALKELDRTRSQRSRIGKKSGS